MNYELKISLDGSDKVEQTLNKLSQATHRMESSGGIMGAISGGGSSPSAKVLNDLDKAAYKVTGMKKEIQSIGTGLAQGVSATGALWLNTAFGSKSAAFQKLNPHLAGVMASLAPALVFKGLRDVGGRDLAKIAGMGSFNDAISKGSIDSQGVPPRLRSGGGGMNLSAIPVFGKFLTSAGAAALALEAFKKGLDTVKATINQGFGIYSGAGQSGLSSQFYTQRTALASTFGVQGNPQQVFMFGKAVTEMSKRIAESVGILSQNAPALAQIHMNMDVLKLDFDAFASSIVKEAAPALNLFIGMLDVFVKKIQWAASWIAAAGIYAVRDEFQIGMSMMGKGDLKTLSQFGAKASPLQALMPKLPGSALEHMGLNIGPGTTNDLIRTTNRYLKSIDTKIPSHNNGQSRASQFGMNPLNNNP